MPDAKGNGSSVTYATPRRWQRYKVDVPIRVIVHKAMKTMIVDGRGAALSEGGMGMFAGAELKPGDQVEVEFTPPYSGLPIRVEARVCNRAGYNYGVEFLTESSSQKQEAAQLRRHLSSLVGMAEE